MIVNIFGSTGIIGKKALKIIKNSYKNYKVNVLCAKENYKLLAKQCNEFNAKYAYLDNQNKNSQLRSLLSKDVKILNKQNLKENLISIKSDLSILSVSGYKSLNYLELILINSKQIGIVSKEAIVSAGHILKKISNKYDCKIFPLDSEHFSIFNFLKLNNNLDYNKIYLTASGGPFLGRKFSSLKNVTLKEAINHPKWKMGYKNSIDSATLVNKCLELIEAHYLFDIPFNKLDILIHPEALVHSIIENKNYTSNMIYFYNDMQIPLVNFLNNTRRNFPKEKKFNFKNNLELNFTKANRNIFPIYNYFKSIDKTNPCNLIKFNVGNEFAVDLFKQKKIKYHEILKFIKKITSLNIDSDIDNMDKIIQYHENIKQVINAKFS